ncbi:beta-lactamase family protein [Streptomyces sp. NBC_00006]|uniref:serine hydrolase domain-containing protein n=1 Tax=unclassified Streptomyces TaxID=2593676 RepID=UPI00225799ED|nr:MULTISPECIES: serine hydrolase domain-containing protein [unclassified Streptomyces]MCX5529168.1 beta-lactamase family protein [Streptomyces sp. NBC_00006]
MSRASTAQAWIAEHLPKLTAVHKVPGAQVAVLVDGEVVDAAAGVVNRATGVPVTPDAVFQIGSITKVWTATLIQQLANEGRLDLDRPVRQYLPEFALADEHAAASVTVRQLLCHTSGVEGDRFTDTGANDDAIERYLPTLADAEQLYPPGEQFSYCNSGYVVLGRLVEVLREQTFNAALREHLIAPLGLAHVATHVGEAILELPAIGHLGPDSQPAPVYGLPPSTAPAGAALAMPARSLLGFVQLHLDERAFDVMRETQVTAPPLGALGDRWGLGWMLYDQPERSMIGHDGGTIGQYAFLRVVPEAGVAVAVLTNGGDAAALFQDLGGHLLGELADARLPALPRVPEQPAPVDAHRATGTYRSTLLDFDLTVHDDGTTSLTTTPRTSEARVLLGKDSITQQLVGLGPDRLITVEERAGRHEVFVLIGKDADGRAQYLHNSRAAARFTG